MKRWQSKAVALLALGMSLGMAVSAYAKVKEYDDGRKAEGNWVADKLEGPGRFYYTDGRRLEAFWVHHSLEGPGIIYEKDGSRRIWSYFDNKLNGLAVTVNKDGTTSNPGVWEMDSEKKDITLESWDGAKGIHYYAEDKTDINDGQAIACYPTGSIYIGDFKNGKRDGWGTFYYADKGWHTGEWKNDMRNGVGYYSFPNDSQYLYKAGIWTNDQCEGGTLSYDKEDGVLISMEKNNKANGPGVLIKGDKTVLFCEYKDGKIENSNPDIYTNQEGHQYIGVTNGKNGSGLMLTKSGAVHIGNFKDGNAEGQGFHYWPSSETPWCIYEGSFKTNQRTDGTLFWPYGTYFKGTFQEDGAGGLAYKNGIYRSFQSYSEGSYDVNSKLYTGSYTSFNKDGSSTITKYKDGKKQQ